MTTRTVRPQGQRSSLRHFFDSLITGGRPRGQWPAQSDIEVKSTHDFAAETLGLSPVYTSSVDSGGAAPPSSILIIDPDMDTVTRQCARRVAAMVGARVVEGLMGLGWGGKPPEGGSGLGGQQTLQAPRVAGRPHLALVATWEKAADLRGKGVCAVIAGASGQICLPGDEEILASALIHNAAERGEEAQARILAVADCGHFDVGRDLALRLARARSATLIDLLGCGPGHLPISREDGVRWADLDQGESAFPPHLGDLLPQVEGVRLLGADARGGALGDAPHLHAVLRAIGGDSVLDVGRWDDRAQQASGYADHTVIICDGSEYSAQQMCGALTLWPPASAISVVTWRRPWVGLSAVLGELPVDVRVLGHTRGGRVLRELWALADGGGGSGERLARGAGGQEGLPQEMHSGRDIRGVRGVREGSRSQGRGQSPGCVQSPSLRGGSGRASSRQQMQVAWS